MILIISDYTYSEAFVFKYTRRKIKQLKNQKVNNGVLETLKLITSKLIVIPVILDTELITVNYRVNVIFFPSTHT